MVYKGNSNQLVPSLGNAVILFATELGCGIGWDEFARRIVKFGPLPGEDPVIERVALKPPHVQYEGLTDHDALRLKLWLETEHNIELGTPTVWEAIALAALKRSFHPVRDYLAFCKTRWDGTKRLDTWLSTYLGAADTKYTRAVGRWTLVSIVARVYQPGCQSDAMLLLEGKQGLGKSAAVEILGRPWHSATDLELHSKDKYQQVQGVAVVEIQEFDKVRGADLATLKSFISLRVDSFRAPYGRTVNSVPRTCTFIGTINPGSGGQYLADKTGNRRYLPVAVGTIDRAGLEMDRDQLFGEAVHRYGEGASWWPQTAEEVALCEAEQEARRVTDPWDDEIDSWLRAECDAQARNGVEMADFKVTTSGALAFLGVQVGSRVKKHEMRVSDRLGELKWVRKREGTGTRPWYYAPTEPWIAAEKARLTAEKARLGPVCDVSEHEPTTNSPTIPSDVPTLSQPCPNGVGTEINECYQSVSCDVPTVPTFVTKDPLGSPEMFADPLGREDGGTADLPEPTLVRVQLDHTREDRERGSENRVTLPADVAAGECSENAPVAPMAPVERPPAPAAPVQLRLLRPANDTAPAHAPAAPVLSTPGATEASTMRSPDDLTDEEIAAGEEAYRAAGHGDAWQPDTDDSALSEPTPLAPPRPVRVPVAQAALERRGVA